MSSIQIKNEIIGKNLKKIFVIAEIGQNHQGSLQIAKEMILKAKMCRCDCVKFQKSCLKAKFTQTALNRSYECANSWGKTYGEHKQFLEFNIEQFKELQNFANENEIMFSASAMDEVSLAELLQLDMPFIKIGSGDANNFHLLELAAQYKTPLIISTGMQTMATIEEIISIMKKYNKRNFALLHCVSAYPTCPKDSSLTIINLFQEKFPEVVIGYSGHEEGILISKIAILQGAKIIERHFTLDKTQLGSDHKCSLEPEELKELTTFVKKIEKENFKNPLNKKQCIELLGNSSDDKLTIEMALKKITTRILLDCEKPCKMKLGKSIVYARNLKKGHIMKSVDLAFKVSEPFGISAEQIKEFFGLQLKRNVSYEDLLSKSDFY